MTDQIERPLTFIRDKANEYAEAKANRIYLEQFRKSKKAILMREAEQDGIRTAAAQEAYAYAHDEYLDLLLGLQAAVHLEERLALQIRAAQLQIDLYRTRQANQRAERQAYGA